MSPIPRTVTAEKFLSAFVMEFQSLLSLLTPSWLEDTFDRSKPWTSFMTDRLTKVGNKLGFKDDGRSIDPEYFHIDMCYFWVPTPGEIKEPATTNKYRWELVVAIEHENDSKDWYYEFTKLSHMNCSLKVLISYFDFKLDGQTPTDQILAMLNSQALPLYEEKVYKMVNDKWLLIFGPTTNNIKKGIQDDYLAFTFDGNKFTNLPFDGRILPKI